MDRFLPKDFKFTSIQVNKNYESALHCDKKNLGPSAIVGLGDYTDGKLWGPAGREWQGVLELIEVGKFAEDARAAQADLAAKMEAQVAELAKGLVPGQAAAAYAELSALLPELAATPAEAELKKLIRRAEKDKAISDEIKAWKLEQEAAALLEEAIAGSEADDQKRVRKALRKLFGKKYRETDSAARGRDRFPEHVPEKKEPGSSR